MRKFTCFFVLFAIAGINLHAQQFIYNDITAKPGFNLTESNPAFVRVNYAVPAFSLEDQDVDGTAMKYISLQGTFLFNDAGMPNLPGKGEYIALPQGATPKFRIVSQITEVVHNVDIVPAPRVPLDNDKRPVSYAKNMQVYSTNALYPASPVVMSEVTQIRGVDAVILGITPFQYNPVTKDLVVYKDLQVEITFEGGNGQFGDQAFRSTWWDPILQDNLLNYNSLPVVDYNARFQAYGKGPLTDECEYIIITPTGTSFLAWADSIRKFRTEQGILTKVFTLTQVGGNTVNAIETFINNAYNNWTIKPAACLLLGDYGTDQTKNVISHLYTHPDGYPNFASDNKYADVNGDEMPDVVFSRITANDASQLQIMVSKFLSYERNPPVNPRFYDKPITALGWQTERWFQLCSEVVGGYFKNVKGKHPRRINKIYSGTPGSQWSTATNTATLVSYFGPSGLNYIPQSPSTLGGWNTGTPAHVVQAVDSGAFMLQHRDHGEYSGWGEPAFQTGNITQLSNTDLTFVFSINCQTGAYQISGECFGEKFHRHFKNGHNSGALGLVCPSEVSYSFVNDTFVWGMYDNMWPDFMPDKGSTPASRGELPAFGAAAGKYFLKLSNWPYNTGDKLVTYRLFHMFGDAFQVLYSEIPQQLTVVHDPEIGEGATEFSIQTNDSAFIALTLNNEILATGYGSATGPVLITIPAIPVGSNVKLTVTKQNFYRYTDIVPVVSMALQSNFTASDTTVCTGNSVDYNDLSSGNPTGWAWEFPGGTPETSNVKNPTGIIYNQTGDHDVTLIITKAGGDPDTLTKVAYIQVSNSPVSDFASAEGCIGLPVQFTDQSNANGGTITSWNWNFNDPASGANNTSTEQNPTHTFSDPGIYNVSLEVTTNGTCSDIKLKDVVIGTIPPAAAQPQGNVILCKDDMEKPYTTEGAAWATGYSWVIDPATAGTISGNGTTGTLSLASGFTGTFAIKVQGSNSCGTGIFSDELTVTVIDRPAANFEDAVGCPGVPVQFTDQSNANGGTLTEWTWNFGDPNSGSSNTSGDQNPVHTFSEAGTYSVSLQVTSNGTCTDVKVKDIMINVTPPAAAKPQGDAIICKNVTGKLYTTAGAAGATTYTWMTIPETAGTITGTTASEALVLTPGFTGTFTIKVQGSNNCGTGDFSEEFAVAVIDAPLAPAGPTGVDSVNVNKILQSEFSTSAVAGAETYSWSLLPANAGTIAGTGLTGTATWNTAYRGAVAISVKAVNFCGESVASDDKTVKLYAPVGIAEKDGFAIEVFPNPNDGKFTLNITAGFVTKISLAVYNTLGKVVYSDNDLAFNGKLHKTIDLSQLAKGVYHLKVEGDGISNTISVVIGK